jgi:hypothetical protein
MHCLSLKVKVNTIGARLVIGPPNFESHLLKMAEESVKSFGC